MSLSIQLDSYKTDTYMESTGRAWAFRIQSDTPVAAWLLWGFHLSFPSYRSNGGSLLLATSAWGTSHVAVNAYALHGLVWKPVMAIVAAEDDTHVTVIPKVPIIGGGGVDAANLGQPVTYTMAQGEALHFVQDNELTGSPIQSDKPIAVFAAHPGLMIPADPNSTSIGDVAELQIPSIDRLGSEYVAVGHRQRTMNPENYLYRIVGVKNGTALTFDPPIVAPSAVGAGEVLEFQSNEPYVVKSQDSAHPFLLLSYMRNAGADGDTEVMRIHSPDRYVGRQLFYAHTFLPETNLVVVRKKGPGGFADVWLDCAGNLAGWAPVGSSGLYEFTRVDLTRHNFEPQGGCDNGPHEALSAEPFGLWLWAWGNAETSGGDCYGPGIQTCDTSYGFIAAER